MEIKYQFYQTEIYSELSELELADEVDTQFNSRFKSARETKREHC